MKWLPSVAWAAAILLTSGDSGSADQTEQWLRPLVAAVFSDAWFDPIHFMVRKAGHVAAYSLLGLLNYYAARHPGLAAGLVAVVAIADETHQSMVATRGGSPLDVALDVASAGIAIAIASYFRAGGNR